MVVTVYVVNNGTNISNPDRIHVDEIHATDTFSSYVCTSNKLTNVYT